MRHPYNQQLNSHRRPPFSNTIKPVPMSAAQQSTRTVDPRPRPSYLSNETPIQTRIENVPMDDLAMAILQRDRAQEKLDEATRTIQEQARKIWELEGAVVRLGQGSASKTENAYWRQRDVVPTPQNSCACGSLSRVNDCEEDRQVMDAIRRKEDRMLEEHRKTVEAMKQQISQVESERNEALKTLSDTRCLLKNAQQDKIKVEALLKDVQRQKKDDESKRHGLQVAIDEVLEAKTKIMELADQRGTLLEEAGARVRELKEVKINLERENQTMRESQIAYLSSAHQERIEYLKGTLPPIKSETDSAEEPEAGSRKRMRVN